MTEIAAIPGLYIDLTHQPAGGYQISAQHLGRGGDYEYRLTIGPAHLAAFARALGTSLTGIAEAWAAQVQQIARVGETTWLARHGVPYEFFSWGEASDSCCCSSSEEPRT